MTLLNTLGLLGLLSIVVLIIIYIIKPNYQQKIISSTFVWKLSLKYRKKKIPTSKLRNILLIICQVLILTACAAILAKPVQIISTPIDETEIIAIIDSSASMRAQLDEKTRFERAIDDARKLTDGIFADNGIVSVILAAEEASFLAQRVTMTAQTGLNASYDELIDNEDGDISCSYGSADIDGAITLCEEVLLENPSAKIYLYTDTEYSYVPDQIELVNVADDKEWNAAILNAEAVLDQNYYAFYVDVAAYGRDMSLDVILEIQGVNATDSNPEGVSIPLLQSVYLSSEIAQKIVFINEDLYQEPEVEPENTVYYLLDSNEKVFSYKSVIITIQESNNDDTLNDSFDQDNVFSIYGGKREVIKVQYASGSPNTFFNGVLASVKKKYANTDRWDVQITEVKKGAAPATEGFDFYVYEHSMPKNLPTDGVVLLANPQSAPTGSDISISGEYDFRKESVSLTEEETHPVLNNVTADNITVSKYVKIEDYDASYKVLMTCDTSPVLLLKNDGRSKVVVMAFSMHYSNLPIIKEFPLLMYNIFEYYFPVTVEGNAFEVGANISLNARGEELSVARVGDTSEGLTFKEFPAKLVVDIPGPYVLSQVTAFDKVVEESIYVKIPAAESNICEVKDALEDPYKEQVEVEMYNDLLLYIAAALVALLFIEWWLQSRENM